MTDKNALTKLRQAIIDNTQGDLFWIGEILLAELEKETGFKGEDQNREFWDFIMGIGR